MKILMAICAVISLNSCATLKNISTDPLKQAFGDALRSLETASIDQIPALIGKLRAQWLPQGQFYSDFAAAQVRAYLAAHPNTPEQAKKILEALATGLNLRG